MRFIKIESQTEIINFLDNCKGQISKFIIICIKNIEIHVDPNFNQSLRNSPTKKKA